MKKLTSIIVAVFLAGIAGLVSCVSPAVTSDLAKEREIQRLAEIEASLKKELADLIKSDGIVIYRYENILIVSVNEQFLFDGESATLKDTFAPRLKKLVNILKQVPEKIIRVVGHTAVWTSKKWPSSWDLGAQRSVNVVRFLQEEAGVDPRILIATTRGEYQPFAGNDNEADRQKNRRVEFILMDREIFDTADLQKVK